MSRPPSIHTTPQSYRISLQLPPSPAYSPSSNGNLRFTGVTDVNQTGQPISSKWQKHLRDTWSSGSSRVYAAACGVITLLLLTLCLAIYFLVQQGGAIRTLTEANQL
ncbi:hypothetical protein CRUP_016223 [Coryphaenoides rupestris]|nr:hypothetical protein CRUP_016223 [Coryphaenoides rupestris]